MSDERQRGGARLSTMVAPALLSVLACVPRPSAEQGEVAPDSTRSEAARGPRCAAGEQRAIALLEPSAALREAQPCGLVLERDSGKGGQLLVRELEQDPKPEGGEDPASLGRGPAPEACGAELELCELWGVSDELGPLVFAQVRGHESEMPIQVYVGWVEAEHLVFVETWYGRSSVVDHTRVGPPWALGPFDCGGELHLLPAPRLPEAAVESASATLRELGGRWTLDEAGEAQQPEQPPGPAIDPASCRALVVALP